MTKAQSTVVVQGSFDNLASPDLRFLEEASRLGRVVVFLNDDSAIPELHGAPPKFPIGERLYLLNALRFVSEVRLLGPGEVDPDRLPELLPSGSITWVVRERDCNPRKAAHASSRSISFHPIQEQCLASFPAPDSEIIPASPGRKKVIVTGCYDWFHSGHVRFFEEVSTYGDLYVIVGHDANIRLLKGAGHPLFPEYVRRYTVAAVRFVHQALLTSGSGWLDAEPEIKRLQPDIYAVNEDGDKGGKREFCAERGIEYLVLKRTPAPGLPARSSTHLRGF